MAIEYTIAAHPTMYRGIRFRSRLEATWAAFFDLLGWRWEYEPFDLNGWVPDFLIHGATRDALVEIKPVSKSDDETITRITKSAGGAFNLLFCGIAPIYDAANGQEWFIHINSSCCCAAPCQCNWQQRFISKLIGKYDIVFGHYPNYVGFVTGVEAVSAGRSREEFDEHIGNEVIDLWGKAKNTTQWRPRA